MDTPPRDVRSRAYSTKFMRRRREWKQRALPETERSRSLSYTSRNRQRDFRSATQKVPVSYTVCLGRQAKMFALPQPVTLLNASD